mmetsp:Transcript_29661/g.63549  ORF Transcript_29661/g.63549 Transcript_29661/m.63549 type:complete len:480 (-) Transcript_29661:222-1661(-)
MMRWWSHRKIGMHCQSKDKITNTLTRCFFETARTNRVLQQCLTTTVDDTAALRSHSFQSPPETNEKRTIVHPNYRKMTESRTITASSLETESAQNVEVDGRFRPTEAFGDNDGSLSMPNSNPNSNSSAPITDSNERYSDGDGNGTGDSDDHSDVDGENVVDLENSSPETSPTGNGSSSSNSIWKEIVDDFDCSRGGDHKILRAIGRTATVNAVVAATAALGPVAAVAGYATGGAITAKRLVGDGIARDNPREIAKSLAVFGSATSASIAGQAITGVVAIGVLGASLPLAGALAFGVGCASGITAGALSEWGVDNVADAVENNSSKKKKDNNDDENDVPERDTRAIETKKTKPNPNSKPNLIQACGAWVDRQKQRNRERSERERRTRGFANPSRVGPHNGKEKQKQQHHKNQRRCQGLREATNDHNNNNNKTQLTAIAPSKPYRDDKTRWDDSVASASTTKTNHKRPVLCGGETPITIVS